MRPDTRSFSFTWLRGQKSTENVRQQENSETFEQQTSGEISKDDKEVNNASGWGSRRGSTGSRLRKLGSSLVRLGGGQRYTSMGEVDEENWHKISEEPMPLDDDDDFHEDENEVEEQMDIGRRINEPDVVATSIKVPQVVMPFATLNTNATAATNPAGMSITKRLNKTVQDVKASLGNFSQKFRKSTRRRYRMGPSTPGNGTSPTRKILGRTPTKLYSPFGIDSPANMKTPKRLLDRPSTPRLARACNKSMISGLVYSPANNFRRDLEETRRGMEDFQLLSRNITRRSVRF